MTTVVVVSPHLDDAIMSLGGTMHRLGHRDILIRVVTLFAGDLSHGGPPSHWDAVRGDATSAETLRARRAEDCAATALLGVEPVWLPFLDASYIVRRDPEEIWAMLGPHLRDADAVLLPGSPLTHYDHRYTTALVVERLGGDLPVVFYAEQPYSLRLRHLWGFLRGTTPSDLQHLLGARLVWTPVDLDPSSRVMKARAVRQYRGELARLGPRVQMDALVARVLRRESLGCRVGQSPPAFLVEAR